MKVGIMQPYFFPYLGYFSLIKNTDKFILLDKVQFIRHGWIERNRILKPGNGWQYISVPLEKHSLKTNIVDIKIKNTIDWRAKIERQLEHYKKIAPNYQQVKKIFRDCVSIDTSSITELNQHALCGISNYLGIQTPIKIFSEMNLSIEQATKPDEWALNICKALGDVDEYWNPEGGVEFFDSMKYLNNNIRIKFLHMDLQPYSQGSINFEPGLSIIDVLMFCSIKETNLLLDNFKLV